MNYTSCQAELTYIVIGIAHDIHHNLGPGLDERFYHELFSSRLNALGIEHAFKPRVELIHRGIVADEFQADIIVPARLVAELKVLWAGFAADNYTQILCYQKFWQIETGLLMDFGKESLMKRRVAYTPGPTLPLNPAMLANKAGDFVTDKALLNDLCERIVRIYCQYGLGYRDTNYRGLLVADLSSDNVSCINRPAISILQGCFAWRGDVRLCGCGQSDCAPCGCSTYADRCRDASNPADIPEATRTTMGLGRELRKARTRRLLCETTCALSRIQS